MKRTYALIVLLLALFQVSQDAAAESHVLTLYFPPHAALCAAENPWVLGAGVKTTDCLALSYQLASDDIALLSIQDSNWRLVYPSPCPGVAAMSINAGEHWLSMPAPAADRRVITADFFDTLHLLRGTPQRALPAWSDLCSSAPKRAVSSPQATLPTGLKLVPLKKLSQISFRRPSEQ